MMKSTMCRTEQLCTTTEQNSYVQTKVKKCQLENKFKVLCSAQSTTGCMVVQSHGDYSTPAPADWVCQGKPDWSLQSAPCVAEWFQPHAALPHGHPPASFESAGHGGPPSSLAAFHQLPASLPGLQQHPAAPFSFCLECKQTGLLAVSKAFFILVIWLSHADV